MADFINRPHLFTANHLDKNTMTVISLLSTKYAGDDLEQVLGLLQKTLDEKRQPMDILSGIQGDEE